MTRSMFVALSLSSRFIVADSRFSVAGPLIRGCLVAGTSQEEVSTPGRLLAWPLPVSLRKRLATSCPHLTSEVSVSRAVLAIESTSSGSRPRTVMSDSQTASMIRPGGLRPAG